MRIEAGISQEAGRKGSKTASMETGESMYVILVLLGLPASHGQEPTMSGVIICPKNLQEATSERVAIVSPNSQEDELGDYRDLPPFDCMVREQLDFASLSKSEG